MSNQRGTLERRGRTWRLKLRRKDAGGRWRWRPVRLGTVDELPTEKAARRAADRYLDRVNPRELHAGMPMEWSAWCDRYIERWLAMHTKGTRRTQTSIIEAHLRPFFKGRMLHELDATSAQDFVVEQRKAHVAPSTIAARFAVLRRMLKIAAEEEGLAATPPTLAQLVLPRDEEVHLAVRQKAFAEAECQAIFAAAAAYAPDHAAFALMRYIGLRGSEACGLTWDLIDLETGAVTVRQQALDGALHPLKTKGSRAVLQAPPELLTILRAYHEAWQAYPNPDRFLFADAEGRPQTSEVMRDALYVHLDTLQLRRRGLHGFRHACALAMADAGCNPEVIRRAMRHSSLRVTAIYLSAAPEDIAAGLARGARRTA